MSDLPPELRMMKELIQATTRTNELLAQLVAAADAANGKLVAIDEVVQRMGVEY